MASLKIIVLQKNPERQSYDVAYWLDVPANKQAFYADPNKTSAYKNISAPDLAALRAGEFVEHVHAYSWTGTKNLATIQAELQAQHAVFQSQLTSSDTYTRFGTRWDGSAWTNVNLT